MDGASRIETGVDGTWIEDRGGFLAIRLTRDLFAVEVAVRACYDFVDRAFVLLSSEGGTRPGEYLILIRRKESGAPAVATVELALELCNALIDHRLRSQIEAQTGDIRTLIMAQAFAEADLLSPPDTD